MLRTRTLPRTLLLGLSSAFLFACAGDNFAPAPQGNAGSAGAATGGASGNGGASAGGGSGSGVGGSAAGSAGATAGSAGASGGGSGGADAGSGGATAGAGGSDAGTGGADVGGAGGSDAGASGSTAGIGGASGAGAAGAAGANGGAAGANGGAAGANGGAAGANAGNGGASGQSGQGGSGPVDCPIVYVAPAPLGLDDPSRGCSPDVPLATIGAALDLARTREASKQTVSSVHICAGEYEEPTTLLLDLPVSLEGSYGCSKGAFSPPTLDAVKTFVTTKNVPVLRVKGNSVGAGTNIQNLSFDASQTVSAETNAAVIVEKNADPTLTACVLVGGTGTDNIVASAGLVVRDGATAKVTRSKLRGGQGTLAGTLSTPIGATSVGSVGLFVARDTGLVTLVDSVVEGGRGSAPGTAVGSAGIALRGPQLKVNGGSITAGTGVLDGVAPKIDDLAVRSVGLDVGGRLSSDDPSLVTISGTTVRGGTAEGPEVSRALGIRVRRTTLTLDHARVYAGDATKATASGEVFGVSAGLFGLESNLTIENTVLHGGGAKGSGNSTGSTAYTRASYFEKSTVNARFVTFLAGRAAGNAVSIQLFGVENHLAVHASLLVAQTPATFGIFGQNACIGTDGPGAAPIANKPVLDNIVFVQPISDGNGHLYQGDAGCGYSDDTTTLAAQGFDVSSVQQVVNALTPNGEPVGVLPVAGCVSNELCPPAVFKGYVALDAGYEATLSGPGLTPRCEMPADILDGATLPAGITDDLARKLREPLTARGAFERSCP